MRGAERKGRFLRSSGNQNRNGQEAGQSACTVNPEAASTPPSSRAEKASRNMLADGANRLLTFALSFWARTVLIRVFGIGILGLQGVFRDILGVLSMADLGIGAAETMSLFQPMAEGDLRKTAALTAAFGRIFHKAAGIIFLGGLLLLPFLSDLIRGGESYPELRLWYLLSLAAAAASYLNAHKSAVLSAGQEGYVNARITMVVNLIYYLAQIGITVSVRRYEVILLIGIAYPLVRNLLISRAAEKRFPCLRKRAPDLGRAEKRAMKRTIRSAFVYRISTVLSSAADLYLISAVCGVSEAGRYSNYQMIQSGLLSFFSLTFGSLEAGVGNLIYSREGRDREKALRVFEEGQEICGALVLVFIPCFFALANPFITVWLGQEYCLGEAALTAVAINLYLSCILQVLKTYREASGLYRKTGRIWLLSAVVNLLLSVLWRGGGTVGILAASAVSVLFTVVLTEPKVLFRELFRRGPELFYRALFRNALLTLLLSIFLKVLNQTLNLVLPGGLLGWLLLAFCDLCVAFLLLFSGRERRKRLGCVFERLFHRSGVRLAAQRFAFLGPQE